MSNEIIILGNYMKSNHDASRVVDVRGVAPCVKENHGTVTAVLIGENNEMFSMLEVRENRICEEDS
jgi:hypothetical protein